MKTSRREFLQAASCMALGSATLGNLSAATLPADKRLVIVVLRGAMDGLHLLRPFGDRAFPALRPGLSKLDQAETRHDINGLYGMCLPDGADEILGLWQRGELSFIQAVSTPYRHGRSHFDGQDLLETGGSTVGEIRSGWLSRMIQSIPGSDPRHALTLSPTAMLLGRGNPGIANWSAMPGGLDSNVSPERLIAMYERDPDFLEVATEALRLMKNTDSSNLGEAPEISIARVAANLLSSDTRIAAFSVGGWDTHANQNKAMHAPLKVLSDVLGILHSGLGNTLWSNTAVICVTEFGRSARENGASGTDHGTGGMALLAGGAIRGQQVHGTYPGLAPGDLYEQRDLLPTGDIRPYIATLFRDLYAVNPTTIAKDVFTGMDKGLPTSLLR